MFFVTIYHLISKNKIILIKYCTHVPTAAASPLIVASEVDRRNGKRRKVEEIMSICSLFLRLGGVLKADRTYGVQVVCVNVCTR